MERFDAIIIGFGKAGKTLAAEMATHGWKVAMVEKSDKMYGGTCPNIACIPTKRLVHEAEISTLMSKGDPAIQTRLYHEAIDRKNALTAALRTNFFNKLNASDNVTIFTGAGSFVNADTVKVALPDGDIEIKGNEIFINTGSTPVMPDIKGIESSCHVYVSTSLLDLQTLPKHLLIVGGGYIGLEFASMYAEFGSKVTVLEGGPKFMPREDRDMAEAIEVVMKAKGIEICLNARTSEVEDTPQGGVRLYYKDASDASEHTIEGDAVLLATGRRPMTEGLDLEAAGIATDERGAIMVDEHLKTNVPHIWALGDVKGGLQFTYISLDDYRIVRDQLFSDGNRNLNDRMPVQYAVFIDPPMSHVGISEEEAKRLGLDFKVNRLPATAIPRAKTLLRTDGLLKAVVHAKTGKILGCTLFCADSSEMINTVAMAMKMDVDYTYLRDFIFTHPSMSEALNDLFDIR